MRQLFLYLLLCLFSLKGIAQTDEVKLKFDKANELYQKEHYADAINAYKSLLEQVSEVPEIYFNLANTYYKQQAFVEAVYYYEKSLKLQPGDRAAQINLLDARKHLQDDIAIIHEYKKSDFLHKVLLVFTVDQWAILSIVVVCIAFAFLLGYFVSRESSRKRMFFAGSLLFFFVTLFSIYAAAFENGFVVEEDTGIVFTSTVSLKEEPKSTASTVIEVHEGAKVYILEENGLWIKVRLDNHEEGWIEKTSIREI